MTDMLHFDLVSPERLLLSEEAEMVTVPGADGDFGVLAGHAPVISTLRPGVVAVKGAPGGDKRFFVRGGFAEVNAGRLTLLAEEAIPLEELDAAQLDHHIRDTEEDVSLARSDAERDRALETLDHLRQLRAAL